MGMKSSKSKGRENKSKTESDLPNFNESRIFFNPPLSSRNNSDIEWELKLANYKIETLETELRDCKDKIEILEIYKNQTSKRLEECKAYEIQSDFYRNQIEEYKRTADKQEEFKAYEIQSDFYRNQIEEYKITAKKQEECISKLRKECDEKIENYKVQLQKYKNSVKSLQRNENSYRLQQVAHKLDLLDLEKRLLEAKIKFLQSVPKCDINKEIEKDRNRLQEIYDEAFMTQKYITKLYYPGGEKSEYMAMENENNKKINYKDVNIAKNLAYFLREENHLMTDPESTQSLGSSARERNRMKRSSDSLRNFSYPSREMHHAKTKSLYPSIETQETCETEYDHEIWNFYISTFTSLSEILWHFEDLSQDIKSRNKGTKKKLHYLLNSYENRSPQYMRDVIYEFCRGFSKNVNIQILFCSPIDLLKGFIDELELTIPLFEVKLVYNVACPNCTFSIQIPYSKPDSFLSLDNENFPSIQSYISSLSEYREKDGVDFCEECMSNQNMKFNIVLATFPKYLIFQRYTENKSLMIESMLMVNEVEYILFAFIFKDQEKLYKAKLFYQESTYDSIVTGRNYECSSALLMFYIKRDI